MAEAFLTSDLVQGFLSRLLSLASEPVIRAWRLQGDLDNLNETMELIRALLSDAERKPSSMEAVRLWLNKLRDVVRDADALLDEVEYEVVRQKVENHKVRRHVTRFKTASKLKEINESLDEIFKRAEKIGLKPVDNLSSIAVENKVIRKTSPYVDDSQIVGRDDDESKVVEMLCGQNSEKHLSVVSIVGMGGLGKTTLARLVYKNEKVMNHFEKRMWVTISQDFDVERTLTEMVQCLTGTNPYLSNLLALGNRLKEVLGGKKFLLVLDDIWNEDPDIWDEMQSCLLGISGARGNKILITNRSSEVSRIMQSSTYPLVGLSGDNSWGIFKQKAFAVGGPIETEMLEAIGKRMVKKCKGLPLAIKTLGASLYYKKTEHEWLEIENNPCWESTRVLPSLRISFDHLQSTSLKQCFAYCSIFPKDFKILKDCLVQQWIALGLLHHRRGCDLEDIGGEYFNILLWNSFLQDVERDKYDNIIGCKMHDLVHDLARDVSKKNYSIIEASDVSDVPQDSIYANLIGANKEKLQNFREGRFQRLQVLYLDSALSAKILKKLKRLRVLVLVGDDIKELPSAIRKLKHMRYLDVSKTSISTMPDSITKLFLLQTVRVRHLEKLPKLFVNLINLRHLYFSLVGESMNCMFTGIRQLTMLRTLQLFVVSRVDGCLLEELGGLDNLSSTLRIFGLGEVQDLEEAKKAKLYKKPNIHSLKLYWDEVNNEDWHIGEDVLQGLEPHSSIKGLKIENFTGKSLASWMMKLHNLVEIKLVGCQNCERVATLGHLPCLKVIEIEGMSKVKYIGAEFYGFLNNDDKFDVASSTSSAAAVLTIAFPALRKLSLEDMEELKEWSEIVGVDHPSSPSNPIQSFPCLEELRIAECPKLKKIPGYFPSLKKLDIKGISDSAVLEKTSRNLTTLTMLVLGSIGGSKIQFVLEELLGNNTSLREVSLSNCKELTELKTDCLQFCTSLEDLYIWGCPTLVSVPDLQRLARLETVSLGPLCIELDYYPLPDAPCPSLHTLRLRGWPKLKSLPHQLPYLFVSLTDLYISFFDGLETLPDWLGNLSDLQSLQIVECKNVMSMPSAKAMRSLRKLKILSIRGCPLLEKRCAKGSGSDWYKIAHLPVIFLNLEVVQDFGIGK